MKKYSKKEKVALEKLEENFEYGSFNEILSNYIDLINEQSRNETYWDEALSFIYFHYKETDQYDWDVYLEKGISMAEKAISYTESKEFQSNFNVYQYKFILELLNHDSFYFEKYNY